MPDERWWLCDVDRKPISGTYIEQNTRSSVRRDRNVEILGLAISFSILNEGQIVSSKVFQTAWRSGCKIVQIKSAKVRACWSRGEGVQRRFGPWLSTRPSVGKECQERDSVSYPGPVYWDMITAFGCCGILPSR